MKSISFIIPAYNESANIAPLYEKLQSVLEPLRDRYMFEILFVNDGSEDTTAKEIRKIVNQDTRVKLIDFSRNFGKEIATTAGLHHCTGDACMMLDADLQHPAELIPDFITKWEEGFDVIIGIREESKSDTWIKRVGGKIFYSILNKISDTEIIPNATDFRLLDRAVIDEFNRFTETKRLTRGLIDWLGFKRAYIHFKANDRLHGTATYSVWKLTKLALHSFMSLSLFPLKMAGYIGILITTLSLLSGTYIFLGKYFFKWYWALTFSDSEDLAIFIVFLVGIILMSIGLISLYIANIHEEVIKRPLYVIRKNRSIQ
ncbi:MAG: glycosyltransferase [Candidatus Moranbacteria bacterium CG_4_10_14_3_um_filter_45_9]|nr:MAG: glycosyltransferase [Candidatus Moranbacteria bacterium CG_4_10_14_3_um_filter_45_9]PJA85768.1 MAG: glycosyltransferase [Candidatus Moranbacteria bacterium CG_4_9_14_3_um_filter_45_14]